MGSFRVEWKKSASKELRKLSHENRKRILAAVEALSTEPYPAASTKLVGARRTRRLRVGDYRVLYTVYSRVLLIEVVRVRHRKDVYRSLP